jgi:hypothetical protein
VENYSFSDLITFTRTTNATLVDGTGNVTYAPNNLLVRSEEFNDAAWSKTNSTIAANVTTAPNGTVTADKHVPDNGATIGTGAAETRVQRNPTATLGVNYVFSIYAKAGEYDQVELALISTPSVSAIFSLTSGTVVSGTGASITPVGDGWYRCAIITTASATGALAVRWSAKSSTVSVGDGVSGIFAWGAQLEEVTYQTTPGTYNSTSPPNLFGFTEEFENAAWVKGNSTVTANATVAPDGTTTADKLVENTATGAHQITLQTAFVSGTPYTWSFYVKAAERSVVRVLFPLAAFTSNLTANFDLATGAWRTGSPTPSPGLTLASQDAGNGWYRISATATATASLNQTILLLMVNTPSGTGNYTGDGTSGLFIWGAQLSNSASVDPYVYNPGAAPTTTAYYGPRFDYNPTTLAPLGLLIEEQRVNLATNSEAVGLWAGFTGATASSNVAVAPDGTTTADKLVESATLNSHFVSQTSASVSYTSGTAYVRSCWLKADGRRYASLFLPGSNFAASGRVAIFDLQAGVVQSVESGVTATITPFANSWYRCTASAVANVTSSGHAGGSALFDNTVQGLYTGDGVSGALIWGAQTEAGAFATSYIPTVAATVTRAADIAVMSGSNFSTWYNQSQGTIVANVSTFAPTGSTILSFQDAAGSANNRNQLNVYSPFSATVVGGVTQANIGTNASTTPNMAYAYSTNNFAACANGAAVAVDSTGTVPTTLAYATLGRWDFGSAASLNGHIRSITFYPYRLADFQLQALTS